MNNLERRKENATKVVKMIEDLIDANLLNHQVHSEYSKENLKNRREKLIDELSHRLP